MRNNMVAKFESLAKTKWLRYSLITLAGMLVLTLVFGAGFAAGRWSVSPLLLVGSLSQAPRMVAFKTGHGAFGAIQTIEGQRITVQSRDGKLQTILVDNDTRFDKDFKQISFTDLKVNDQIVVIGSPNADGEINARLIGLVDPSTFRFPVRTLTSPRKSK